MLDDVQTVADFYSRKRGSVAAGQLRRRLQGIWPDLQGQSILGLGHASPFLPLWHHQARLCIDASTSIAATPLQPDCLVQDDALPFPDQTFDRVLMTHALENATHAPRMLHAAWRVLRNDGRLLIVVPNRTGLWAHIEATPFADGTPYSTGRIARLLQRCLFRVEQLQGALYFPPSQLRSVLRAGPVLESAGRFLTPRLAGVLVIEAVKDMYAAHPAAPAARQVRFRSVLMPAGAVPASRNRADRVLQSDVEQPDSAALR